MTESSKITALFRENSKYTYYEVFMGNQRVRVCRNENADNETAAIELQSTLDNLPQGQYVVRMKQGEKDTRGFINQNFDNRFVSTQPTANQLQTPQSMNPEMFQFIVGMAKDAAKNDMRLEAIDRKLDKILQHIEDAHKNAEPDSKFNPKDVMDNVASFGEMYSNFAKKKPTE